MIRQDREDLTVTELAVRIRAALFDQIVMDRWGWSAAFNATNSAYVS
jgi:hypothetical protein